MVSIVELVKMNVWTIRQAVAEYFRRQRERAIAKQYERAYRSNPTLGEEFAGWEDQGSWPEERNSANADAKRSSSHGPSRPD